jgi:hypothetical protein
MQQVPPFNAQHLTSIAKVLAETADGLTGSEIGYLLFIENSIGLMNMESLSPNQSLHPTALQFR